MACPLSLPLPRNYSISVIESAAGGIRPASGLHASSCPPRRERGVVIFNDTSQSLRHSTLFGKIHRSDDRQLSSEGLYWTSHGTKQQGISGKRGENHEEG